MCVSSDAKLFLQSASTGTIVLEKAHWTWVSRLAVLAIASSKGARCGIDVRDEHIALGCDGDGRIKEGCEIQLLKSISLNNESCVQVWTFEMRWLLLQNATTSFGFGKAWSNRRTLRLLETSVRKTRDELQVYRLMTITKCSPD